MVQKCIASFDKHPCPLLHSSVLAQKECSSSVSDQWHSVGGHKILLLRSHRSLMLGHMLVLWWCSQELPSGRWWTCWRLGDIPWLCSQCPGEEEIQCHAHVYLLFYWTKPSVLPVLLFRQSSFFSFHRVQGCSICTCPFRVLVPEVSHALLVSLLSKCLWWCCLFLESSMVHR